MNSVDSGLTARIHNTSSSWRQLIANRMDGDEIEMARALAANGRVPEATQIRGLLARAQQVTEKRYSPLAWWTGGPQDLAWMSLHEAEAQIDEVLKGDELRAHARDLLVKARSVLPSDDPRMAAVAAALENPARGHRPELKAVEVAHLARAVNRVADERYAQSRSFRNRLIRLSFMSLMMLGLLLAGFAFGVIPIGNARNTPLETALLLSLFGAVGALITAVPPLSRVAGTWNPFSLPLYQLLLKLVLGPTFAIVGVMMLQAGVVPNVQSPLPLADLLVWGLVFGASQQVVTRFVDQRVAGLVSSEPSERAAAASLGTTQPGEEIK